MWIRCQRCHALFALQDGLSGSRFEVECGRCGSVFGVEPALPQPPRDLAEMPEVRQLSRAWRIAALSGVAVAAMLALGIWLAMRTRLPREAAVRVERARELLLLDDARSLERATALFTEAARIAAGRAEPEGERAFALLLQGAAWKDLADRLQKDSAAAQERDKYAAESQRLLQSGGAAAKAAMDEDGEDPAALRAMAMQVAVSSGKDDGTLARARRAQPSDPWLGIVSAMQWRGEPDRAWQALEQARQAEPRLLRADVEMAALAMDQHKPGAARRALARVLQANPDHERAKRLLAMLPAR